MIAVGGDAENTLVGLVLAPSSGVECCDSFGSSEVLDAELGSSLSSVSVFALA